MFVKLLTLVSSCEQATRYATNWPGLILLLIIFKLWKMQSKDFVALVVISCLIAIPIAWYFLNQWLQNYSYRAELSWWIFGVSISGALIITIITVSFQAIKAAMMNPVRSLRTE